MAQQSTRMLAYVTFAAQLAARVRNVVAIVRGILKFATKAIIMIGCFLGDMLTGWTTPTRIRLGTVRPLNDARQMNDVKTITARPARLEWFDVFATDKAFETTGLNFSHELFAL